MISGGTKSSITTKNITQTKQKDQHRRSVETLGLSDHGDTSNIAQHKPNVNKKKWLGSKYNHEKDAKYSNPGPTSREIAD